MFKLELLPRLFYIPDGVGCQEKGENALKEPPHPRRGEGELFFEAMVLNFIIRRLKNAGCDFREWKDGN